MGARQWTPTSKSNPCPICQKPDWCSIGERFVHCMRAESDKPCKSGGWLHRRDGDMTQQATLPPVVRVKRTDAELDAIWKPRVRSWCEGHASEVCRLSAQLGVSLASLLELNTGWDGRAWTMPERNADGLIVGINRRFEDGSKRCAKGSRRGLTYNDGWADAPGPVLLVEGASDVATAITMGLAAIGRPSNTGGVAMLAKLLARHPNRKEIVIGERDGKTQASIEAKGGLPHDPHCRGCNRCRPGVFGMRELTKRLGTRASGHLLPAGAKDLRSWWRATGAAVEEGAEVGRKLLRDWGYR